MQALAEQSRIVRLPINQLGSVNKIKKAFSILEQKFEREPSNSELSIELEVPEESVANTMKISGKHVSVDAPFVAGEEHSLLDVLENPDSPLADNMLMNESLRQEINRSLATLTQRESDVVKLFYGIGCNHSFTLEEIGAKFDLTKERVRQIKEKAIRRLRHNSRSKLLKTYLG
jgi:RNA polymerase primary sigma factor